MPFRYISRRRQMIKSFYSGIGKTAVIFPAAFLAGVGLGTLLLGLNFYLQEVYEARHAQIGAFFALWSFSYIVGCLVVRPLTDAVRPRYLLMAATFSMCVFALAIHYSGTLVLAFGFFCLVGLSASLFWPPIMGWLSSDAEGTELSTLMSRFNLSWSSGAIISPFLAGWLSQRDAALPIHVASALFLLTSFLIAGAALALPRVRNDGHVATPNGETRGSPDRSPRLRYSGWVGLFTAFVVVGIVVNIFPISARAELHLSKRVIGELLLWRALFGAIGFWILGRMTFWHYRSSQMILGQLCLAGGLVAMVCASHPLVIGPILAVLGLMYALAYSNGLFHGVEGSPNRAARSAMHEALLSAGLFSGSLLGGIIYEHYSIAATYLFGAAVVLAGVIAQTGIALWVRCVEPRHPTCDAAPDRMRNPG